MNLDRIITHDDFDGIASAAICAHVLNMNHILFTGPRTITESRLSTTEKDVVCDLPYPLTCGLWFDHHPGNLEELGYRGVTPDSIPGRFDLQPSCCHVVHDYFQTSAPLPSFFEELVREADIIDSFAYEDIDSWRRETPGKIIDTALKLRSKNPSERRQFMKDMTHHLKDHSLEETAGLPAVHEWYTIARNDESQMLDVIKGSSAFLAEDTRKELIILDLTPHARQPHIVKNLAYLIYPQALGVVQVKNRYRKNVKTNDLAISMSLSLKLNQQDHSKDVGEIMRLLNIGDGHAGAGAGTVDCPSKEIMLKTKNQLLSDIYINWSQQ